MKKIKIGWIRLNVYEKILPLICFRCNFFGHTEKTCPNGQICGKCGGDHKIKLCQSKTFCCPNCNRKNTKFNTQNPVNHLPWSNFCPVYKRRVNLVKNRINYEK